MKGTHIKRVFYGIASIDEYLFVIGGKEGGIDEYTTTVESYNSITQRWELKSPLKNPRM